MIEKLSNYTCLGDCFFFWIFQLFKSQAQRHSYLGQVFADHITACPIRCSLGSNPRDFAQSGFCVVTSTIKHLCSIIMPGQTSQFITYSYIYQRIGNCFCAFYVCVYNTLRLDNVWRDEICLA